MHVLDFLRDPKCDLKPEDCLDAEYRLLCSGTLYRRCLSDWSKSEVARILLNEPLLLFVASRPFEDYPLELALQLTVPQVMEEEKTRLGNSIYMYHPDEEVVRDLAALLSLLCRRLITMAEGERAARELQTPPFRPPARPAAVGHVDAQGLLAASPLRGR